MELEFDKEMDAILRKARGGLSLHGAAVGGPHIDADTIAAFAENALPQATKTAFIQHFADCDDCRRRLSRAMSMHNEVPPEPSSVVSTATTVTPWYRGLFRTPGLAFAMGALVLVFSGLLAFLVLQNNESGNAIVSQRTENEPSADGLFSSGAAANAASSNIALQANSLSNANSSAVATEATPDKKQSTDFEKTTGTATKENAPAAREENSYMLDGASGDDAAKPAAAPPVTVTTDVTVGEVEKKDEDDKAAGEPPKDAQNLAKSKMTESRRRDSPPPAAKSGPSRSGPLQNQSNQINNNLSEMSVTRSVGGKKFSNRDGVWYDSAYRGQATTNYRRSSTDYKSLDSGLRSIADTLGGTVIVLWKGKAYRIN